MSNILIQPLPLRENFYDNTHNYYSPFRGLFILEDIFQNSLTAASPQMDTPKEIKVPLRIHQKALLHAMEQMETDGLKGRKIFNETLFTNHAILGDKVGMGKSLTILSHIARMKNNTKISYNNTSVHNCPSLFSIKEYNIVDLSSSTLVIVPHNLFRQWQEYINDQTTLNACYVKNKADMLTPEGEDKLVKKILSADFTLVSNTLFQSLSLLCRKRNIEWRRVFIDEADSIHIVSTTAKIKAGFIWFVTASWANMLFCRDIRFTTSYLTTAKNHAFHPEVKKWLERELNTSAVGTPNNYYYTSYYNVRSSNYFKEYLSTHPLRGNVVLLNSSEFLEQSINMPAIKEQIITCAPLVAAVVLGNLINENVRSLLHAGDVKGALEALGVNQGDNMSLIQAVNHVRQKELDNYKKTLAFKETLEYATTHAKENALKNLREKIHSLEEQMKSLRERLENVSTELCAICYDEPSPITLTPCCNQIFCGNCILRSLEKNTECPMCRTRIDAKKLMMIGDTPAPVTPVTATTVEEPKPLKKHEALLKLIRENPNGKFLVFSRYDNPFEQIASACEAENITIRQVKGNKDVVNATVHSFESGKTRVLYLNSSYSGAGLNIISASHVVLLHAMTSEEQKQIIGRAYRLGRTSELNVVKLLHPGEA